MGADLKIVVLNGDDDYFENIQQDLEWYWQFDDIHRTEVKVLDIGYYKPFATGFLIDHYDDGILGTAEEFLAKLKDQQSKIEDLVDKEYVTEPDEIASVKEEISNLIAALEQLDAPYTNRQVIMVRY